MSLRRNGELVGEAEADRVRGGLHGDAGQDGLGAVFAVAVLELGRPAVGDPRLHAGPGRPAAQHVVGAEARAAAAAERDGIDVNGLTGIAAHGIEERRRAREPAEAPHCAPR